MDVIQLKDVWEMYRIKFITEGKTSWENFWALKGISFKAEKGETLGIIGENGAGKSTILKLIMEMLRPDRGEIEVKGKTSGLLELGAGFQPELTGRENVYLNAGLFGLSKSDIEAKYEEIANFAALGKFIDAPVKCYSQGMFVRLAFSIAIHVDPDTLLIDDTLAVGDEHFQKKCIKKIFELKDRGKTIVLVTHDMNMLRRLCKRAVFLKDGRIVKDGPVEDVMPLYTQTVGVKEGVGILKRGNLNLIFNNGRLFISWKDKIITPNSGAYTSFLISDKWFNSLQADWQVQNEGENRLVATGKLYQLALTQIWKIELCDNYEIKWDIEFNSQEPVEMKEGFTNILLTDEYTRWFTASERGDFPVIDDKTRHWHQLLDINVTRKCMGVEAKNNPDKKIPSLVFELSSLSHNSRSQILNTDYLSSCRVLQYKTFNLQNYSADQANSFSYFSGKIILDIPDIDSYLRKLEDEFTLSAGKLKLTLDSGRGIISWRDVNLTKSNHMFTSIYVNGRLYTSNLAHWEIKKEKADKLVARGTWQNLPIEQIWEVEMRDDSFFLWKVGLRVHREVDIEEQYAWLMCSNEYEYWFSEFGKGIFPGDFLESNMDIAQRCISDGIVGVQAWNNEPPSLSLKFSKELGNFAKILNSDFYCKSRILRIERVEPEENMRFFPGEHPSFIIELSLDENKKQVSPQDLVNILENGKLRFIFENGAGRIYWEGAELTKKLGLYTSLRSNGRWYDSGSSAIWKIEEKTGDTIKASGRWLDLPISQSWEIRLKEDRLVEFIVGMRVGKTIEIDRFQTNVMLSEKYKEWLADGKKGTFPAFKGNIDDDWEVLWSNSDNKKSKDYLGILANHNEEGLLPTVIFSPEEIDSKWGLNIINSDLYHRGRVMQYLKKEREVVLPGEYLYYKGKIKIETP